MTWKIFLLRFAGLILVIGLGFALYPIMNHALILSGLMPTDEGSEGFGQNMMRQAMYLYMASVPVGFAGIFINDKNWRWPIYLCPLYAPSLFALIHTITHN